MRWNVSSRPYQRVESSSLSILVNPPKTLSEDQALAASSYFQSPSLKPLFVPRNPNIQGWVKSQEEGGTRVFCRYNTELQVQDWVALTMDPDTFSSFGKSNCWLPIGKLSQEKKVMLDLIYIGARQSERKVVIYCVEGECLLEPIEVETAESVQEMGFSYAPQKEMVIFYANNIVKQLSNFLFIDQRMQPSLLTYYFLERCKAKPGPLLHQRTTPTWILSTRIKGEEVDVLCTQEKFITICQSLEDKEFQDLFSSPQRRLGSALPGLWRSIHQIHTHSTQQGKELLVLSSFPRVTTGKIHVEVFSADALHTPLWAGAMPFVVYYCRWLESHEKHPVLELLMKDSSPSFGSRVYSIQVGVPKEVFSTQKEVN